MRTPSAGSSMTQPGQAAPTGLDGARADSVGIKFATSRSLHFFTVLRGRFHGLEYARLGQVVTLSLGPLAFGQMDPVVRSPGPSPLKG